ncbi:hypothetical protein ASD44_00770 [Mesorhizobium sp. Root554]|uniref:hypothetical protein n=1 Tax=unclassified Mesorhizobium TaxID=325217 RepID=UPI0006F5FC15|nr:MULTISPECIES: hypothetical protein [unclassified Mesorhizobium]KQZ12755.1 hypothetical protein ASD27_00770 [Mesorhizobium sp. Root1471]KQZ35277.1 hypothetical protein ASD44_00770 [Mesorhizobium sp. Root554]
MAGVAVFGQPSTHICAGFHLADKRALWVRLRHSPAAFAALFLPAMLRFLALILPVLLAACAGPRAVPSADVPAARQPAPDPAEQPDPRIRPLSQEMDEAAER